MIYKGYPAQPKGPNSEGLRRRGFSADQILQVRRAYKTLYREGLALDDARAKLQIAAESAPVIRPLVEFLAAVGARGILR